MPSVRNAVRTLGDSEEEVQSDKPVGQNSNITSFITGDGIRAPRREPSSCPGTSYGSRPTPRIMSVNLLSFLSGSKMGSTFKLTMHGS
jgi:hypothetical protein